MRPLVVKDAAVSTLLLRHGLHLIWGNRSYRDALPAVIGHHDLGRPILDLLDRLGHAARLG